MNYREFEIAFWRPFGVYADEGPDSILFRK